MTEHEHRTANPDRTRIEEVPRPAGGHEYDTGEPYSTSGKQEPDEPPPAAHDQPWRKVAEEVREAAQDAEGPFD